MAKIIRLCKKNPTPSRIYPSIKGEIVALFKVSENILGALSTVVATNTHYVALMDLETSTLCRNDRICVGPTMEIQRYDAVLDILYIGFVRYNDVGFGLHRYITTLSGLKNCNAFLSETEVKDDERPLLFEACSVGLLVVYPSCVWILDYNDKTASSIWRCFFTAPESKRIERVSFFTNAISMSLIGDTRSVVRVEIGFAVYLNETRSSLSSPLRKFSVINCDQDVKQSVVLVSPIQIGSRLFAARQQRALGRCEKRGVDDDDDMIVEVVKDRSCDGI